MSGITFGCQTYPWKMNKEKYAGEVPHILEITKKAGFSGLEAEIDMLGPYFDRPEEVKALLEENHLRLSALVLHQSWKYDKETEEEKEFSDKAIHFLTFFPFAKLMLSHHAIPGDRTEGEDLKKRRENLFSCMASVADRAGEQGIVAAFHPNSSKNSLFRTEEDYRVMFDLLEKTYIGWIPDVGHIVNGGMDVMQELKDHRSMIRHVHFKDRIAENQWAVMGEGSIDYPAIVKYLKDTGYSGWIMVEDESPACVADSDGVVMKDGQYMKQFMEA